MSIQIYTPKIDAINPDDNDKIIDTGMRMGKSKVPILMAFKQSDLDGDIETMIKRAAQQFSS